MSADDELDEDEQRVIKAEARAQVLEGVQMWLSQSDAWEGGIITGYVLAVEVTRPGEDPQITWVTGNGLEPREGDAGGLARHRADGIVRAVERDIFYRDVRGCQ